MDESIHLSADIDVTHDESSGVYRATYARDCDESLSTVVVSIVAAIAEVDPLDLEPLRNHLDPDALDDLFTPTHSGCERPAGEVRFPFAGHRVSVSANGDIEIRPQE
ncbi:MULTISPECIES: HalOD1 output domain-containing protein [Halorussus]|uniref:HalOD1 output domain-containing protein n=1 Tax=Halorussus TaxID=1070314 RepID=UPI00209D101E|nr:HalOD1 output domain-containing protein [Halorussus vallis]USZ76426.1 hypothetical protein NGM07_03645 [Halorussus vallis]